MTAPNRTFTAGLLGRTGLLVGLLAIVAGIFGMHVMTGPHGGLSPADVSSLDPGADAGIAAAGNHAFHPGAGASRPQPEAWAVSANRSGAGTPGHLCPGSETSLHALTGSCIPSVKTGSLSAPPPGTAVAGIISPIRAAGAVRADWGYRPGTPSPGELSISRT